MMYWHFIRHLPPLPEAYEYLYGRDEVPVDSTSDMVRRRISDVAAVLPSNAAWHVSPTPRTLLTAQCLLEARPDLSPSTTIEDEAFIEQHFGDFAGRRYAELHQDATFKDFGFGRIHQRPNNGESFSDVFNRVGTRLNELREHPENQNRVIVTHGGVILALASYILKIPMESVHQDFALSPLMHISLSCEPHNKKPGENILRFQSISQGIDLRVR